MVFGVSAGTLDSLATELSALGVGGGSRREGGSEPTLGRVAGQLGWLDAQVERSDAPPTPAMLTAGAELEHELADLQARLAAARRRRSALAAGGH